MRVCSSFWECRHGQFPSCSHHAKGRKWGLPKTLVQLEFIGAGLNKEHLGLFRSYLSHPNSESPTFFFLLDSLFFKEHCVKIWEFATGSTSLTSFFLPTGQQIRRGYWRTTLFLAFLVPLFRSVRALVFPIGLENGFRFDLGHFGLIATHLESMWILGKQEIMKLWEATAYLGKWGAKWVGVSRLKVGISRAEGERKWGGANAKD